MKIMTNREKLWHKIFMNMAYEVSKASTCARVKVGAILIKDRRPISIGINGVTVGKAHCEDIFKQKYNSLLHKLESCDDYENNAYFIPQMAENVYGEDVITYRQLTFEEYMALPEVKEEHGKFSQLHEIHAEVNVINFCAKNGISTKDTTLYTTTSPCMNCCKSIISAGITAVIYDKLYDRDSYGLQVLKDSGVKVIQMSELLW